MFKKLLFASLLTAAMTLVLSSQADGQVYSTHYYVPSNSTAYYTSAYPTTRTYPVVTRRIYRVSPVYYPTTSFPTTYYYSTPSYYPTTRYYTSYAPYSTYYTTSMPTYTYRTAYVTGLGSSYTVYR